MRDRHRHNAGLTKHLKEPVEKPHQLRIDLVQRWQVVIEQPKPYEYRVVNREDHNASSSDTHHLLDTAPPIGPVVDRQHGQGGIHGSARDWDVFGDSLDRWRSINVIR
jgi:hypothetical protein